MHIHSERWWLAGLVSGGVAVAILLTVRTGTIIADAPGDTIRVGVFDTRAVALAYSRSEWSRDKAILDQQHQANDAVDQAGEQKLKTAAAWTRMKLQRQVFGRARVDDALAPVLEQLPAIAKAAGVRAITSDLVFADKTMEQVDITEQLVALYHPDAKTRKIINDMKGKPPLTEEQLMRMEAAEHGKGR